MTSDVPNMRLAGQLRGFVPGAEVPAEEIEAGAAVLESIRLLLVCQQSDRTPALADLVDEQIARIDAALVAWRLRIEHEHPAEEIAVTPAMIEVGREVMRRLSSVASDNYLSHEACNVYRAMERARRAEASLTFGPEWRQTKMAAYNNGELIPIEQPRPPGYRSASEDEQ